MSFSIEIDPEWNIIRKIKEAIHSDPQMQELDRDFREATLLVAIELVENAFKYSNSGLREKPVHFSFTFEDGYCRLKVMNQSNSPENRNSLQAILDEIAAGDPFEMYVKRLEALRDRPDGFSRMGLIRIVYEGEYELNSNIEDDMITMVATRKVPVK